MIEEILDDRPCLVAMESGIGNYHAVVLRGYSSLGFWSIWNPWYSVYETYPIDDPYVPCMESAEDYSYTPYMHAFNFC